MFNHLLRLFPVGVPALLFGAFALCSTVQAGEWFELGGFGRESAADAPSDTLLEVDIESLQAQGKQRSLVVRLSFRPGRTLNGQTIRSLRGHLRLACDSGDVSWQEVRFFSGEKGLGELLTGLDAVGPDLPLGQTHWLPPAGEALLRKSACAQVHTATP